MEPNSICNLSFFVDVVHNVLPQERLGAELFKVTDAVERMLCSGERDTDSVVNAEKANGSLPVAANQTEQNDIILLALVVVYSGNADTAESVSWHPLLKRGQLAGVGCEDGDGGRGVALLQEIPTQLHQEVSFVIIL